MVKPGAGRPGAGHLEAAYLDASAIVKLVADEPETDALRRWLGSARMVTSRIAMVEVGRAASRLGPDGRATAFEVLESLEIVELDAELAAEAARIGPLVLRALDAIHLATALRVRSAVPVFVAYDRRLADAAEAAGLEVVTPS